MSENKINQKKLVEMANLELDCKIGKDKHFTAALRKEKKRVRYGLFAVIGSAIIASGIDANLLDILDVNNVEKYAELIKGILSLAVAVSTAIIGFLGLETEIAQHNFVANSYIGIGRRVRGLLNEIDAKNYSSKIDEYEKLLEQYLEINKESESCQTSSNDSISSIKANNKKRGRLKYKQYLFDKEDLGLEEQKNLYPKKSHISLASIILKSLKYRTACLLRFCRIIRNSDFLKYIKTL